MLGMMQNSPLLISTIIDHAEAWHSPVKIISRTVEGRIDKSSWGSVAKRSKQVANLLSHWDIPQGSRIASLAWNTHRHLELYFGVSGGGHILHTVNPRLFDEQIIYIINHAEDEVLFFDADFMELVERIAPALTTVKKYVVLTDQANMPQSPTIDLLCYETLLSEMSHSYTWPMLDENEASSLCYTSGTSGNPKGVLYSHRSSVLHAFAAQSADGMAISNRDSILVATPLFHVNSWGVPYASAMSGAKLVLPGPALDGQSLYELMSKEQCTLSLGVPTVWLNFFEYITENCTKEELQALKFERVVVGGSAAPRRLVQQFDEILGVHLIHAWGMTETSPLATVSNKFAGIETLSPDQRYDIQITQGRCVYGVQLAIFDEDDNILPPGEGNIGEVKVRGPWIMENYFKHTGLAVLDDNGWLATGDLGKIDASRRLILTDRSKDVIKSGGEWISSIDLENAALNHPDIAEAAVIGATHPKWQERPILLVIPQSGKEVSEKEVLEFLSTIVARWWLPDAVITVDSLPKTATGKLLKRALRDDYGDHLLKSAP
jgi:fatty-acyl-CoA synthase